MARILLSTSPAVIGLEEIDAFSEFTEAAPIDLIVAALNEEATGGAGEGPWQGFSGQIPGLPQRLALAWNGRIVDKIALRELSELRVGYTKEKRYPAAELRFPRIPLAGRFRLKEIPAFDFTVVVMHLKAIDLGFENGLDENDIRRRGELEDFLFKWALQPEAQGDLRDEEMAVMGDLNETAENLVYLLDQYGSTTASRGLLALTAKDLAEEKAVFFFADGEFSAPAQYTYMGNSEKGEKNSSGMVFWRDTVWSDRRSFIDHILLSRALAPRLVGPARPVYFDRWYPVSEHVRFSDHRPITVRLSVPRDYAGPGR
jgi:endonuclease/exonuclease/phosphatase family metal-dependent hydrolase